MPAAILKLTPLHFLARRLGAHFVDQGGWSVPQLYTRPEEEVAAARRGVALADESPRGRLLVQGDEAGKVLREAFALPGLEIGAGGVSPPARVYGLRPDLFFVATPPGAEEQVRQQVRARAAGTFLTCTDITHGRAEIRVVGPASRPLLSKVCGLDFSPGAFAEGAARQSSAAGTTQLIIRRDCGPLPAFSLVGGQSLGAYMWEVLMEAGREWGITPMGLEALEALETEAGTP